VTRPRAALDERRRPRRDTRHERASPPLLESAFVTLGLNRVVAGSSGGAADRLAAATLTADTEASRTTEAHDMALSFGVTVLPDPPVSRLVELMKLGEDNGFEIGWTYDSHVLWQESFVQLTMAIQATSRLKFGHLVTNPGTREPTVLASLYATMHDISDGRMVMGIGRGDSARRYIGQQPVRVAEFERRLEMIKPFMNGQEVSWNDKELQLKWVRPELPEIPMWVAGYGPKALAVAGRVGDGVIIQLADPEIIQWIMGTARAAAAAAGRDPSALKCIVCAPSHVGPLEDGREQTRWFPAMVSNHVKDLIERYGTDGSIVPKALTDYVEARKFYDYDEHSRVGAKHGEFVTDEICDRFSVLGDIEQITTKLRELESIGVDHYSIYLMTHGQEETLDAYGKHVIPQFTGAAA
jgi:probable F420-dependent oxidoreductase